MTIAWMLCYLAVGGLLVIVAASLDVLAAQLRYPRRAIWSGAMLAMCVLPLTLSRIDAPLPLRDATARAVHLPESLPTTAPLANAVNAGLQSHEPSLMLRVTKADRNGLVIEPESVLRRGDLLLPALSFALSLGCVVLLVQATLRMRRAQRGWLLADTATAERVSRMAGRRVRTWVSGDIGPAAFGVRRPQVVIPAWADTLAEPARTLLLTHEASHVAARDPLLLRVALALVVIMPWNVALLYAYRRLHRAVEQDCDARVLRSAGDARSYGRLLLEAAERLARGGEVPRWSRVARWLPTSAVGMGVRRSDLELRLRALVRPVSTWRSRVRNVAAAVVMIAAGLVACSVPAPKESNSTPGEVATTRVAVDSSTGFLQFADSLSLSDGDWDALPKLSPRLDTMMVLVAHRLLPEVWSDTSTQRQVWLLLDGHFKVLRATTGVRHNFTRPVVPIDVAELPHATEQTPESLLVMTPASYESAFPEVASGTLKSMTGTATLVNGRRVRINWARIPTANGGGAQTGSAGAPDRAMSVPESLTVLAGARARVLSAGLMSTDPTEPALVWMLYDTNGVELAHHVDHGIVLPLSPAAFASSIKGFRTARTTEHHDTFGCDGIAERFSGLKVAARLTSCSMSVSVERPGERKVSLIVGVTQAPL